MDIHLKLTLANVNMLLTALGEFKYKEVVALITDIQEQTKTQTEQKDVPA